MFHSNVVDGCISPFVSTFTNEMNDLEKAASHTKTKVCTLPCLTLMLIGLDADGPLGGHSTHKFALTHLHCGGVCEDDKDHRGRWKSTCRTCDGHNDVQSDLVDAKVAAMLCPGGVCCHEVVDPSCASKWMADNATPNIKEVFSMQLTVLFGKVMLWLACSPNNGLLLSAKLQAIQDAHCNCATFLAGSNPVQKVAGYCFWSRCCSAHACCTRHCTSQ